MPHFRHCASPMPRISRGIRPVFMRFSGLSCSFGRKGSEVQILSHRPTYIPAIATLSSNWCPPPQPPIPCRYNTVTTRCASSRLLRTARHPLQSPSNRPPRGACSPRRSPGVLPPICEEKNHGISRHPLPFGASTPQGRYSSTMLRFGHIAVTPVRTGPSPITRSPSPRIMVL